MDKIVDCLITLVLHIPSIINVAFAFVEVIVAGVAAFVFVGVVLLGGVIIALLEVIIVSVVKLKPSLFFIIKYYKPLNIKILLIFKFKI